MAVWSRIKKPSPAAFFKNMRPDAADGHLRQALIMTWMMLPPGSGHEDVRAVITHIFERQLATWEEDDQTLRKGLKQSKQKKVASAKKAPAKVAKKPSKKGARRR